MSREDALLELIRKKYRSLRNFSIESGIPNSTLNSMFKKGIGGTAVDTVLHVCSLLDCDIYSLTGSGQDADANDRIFFSKYLKLSDSDKELMRLVLEHQLKGYTADNIIEFPVENTLRANSIRIYTNSASAGFGEYIEDSDYIDIDMQEQFPSEADFGVTIHGDSMTPEICDGDVVWVKSEQNVENNDIGVFILNGDSLCKKKIVVGGKIYLRSLNEKYSDIEITEFDDLTVVGKVLGSCPFPN